MTGILELSDRRFKTMINILSTLMDRVESMKKQMDNVNREMEVLGKNLKEMLEMKNTVT